MPNLVLYHAIPSRSSIVRWMLEEVDEPYDIHLLDLVRGDNREPDYLSVNPMGKVPALRHGNAVITEAAAICCYLADAFPEARLSIPAGDPRRGPYLSWLFFGPSCIEPAMLERAFPRQEPVRRSTAGFGDFDSVMDVLAQGAAAVNRSPMRYGLAAADVVIGASLRWGMQFKLLPERPEFAPYVSRLSERPALKRATELDAKLQAERSAGG